MLDLSDVTFTIPLRIDSQDRLENFIIILSYLVEKFETNIIILEDDGEQKISFDSPPKCVKYIFQKNEELLFHKAKLINQLCKEARTPIVALHDCDVLFPEEQYIKSADSIRSGLCDLCLPHDSFVYDIERIFARNILKDFSVKSLPTCNVMAISGNGGCVFYNKTSFVKGGMANENIRSWGTEDAEILMRFNKLGFKVKRIEGYFYHLKHPRGINSSKLNTSFEQDQNEFKKIASMTNNELEDYIATWKWAHL